MDTQTPERIITDTDARLFSVKGLAHRFPDTLPYILAVENPVKVLSADGKPMGFATVFPVEGGGIMAEALFEYSCPERLSIEAGLKLFFQPEMRVEFEYKKDGEGVLRRKVHVSITQLMLSQDPPSHPDIDPVREMSEEESP